MLEFVENQFLPHYHVQNCVFNHPNENYVKSMEMTAHATLLFVQSIFNWPGEMAVFTTNILKSKILRQF